MEQPDDIRSLFKADGYTPRPASIVIKFNKQSRFKQSVSFYKQLLGIEGICFPDCSQQEEYHVFQVGSQEAQDDKDIELRLVHRDKSGRKENQTVVYWCVSGESLDDLKLVHERILDSKKYHQIDPPTPDDSSLFGSTARSLLEDEAGNQVGLLVIPPFPHGKSLENHKNKKATSSTYLFSLAGTVASLALGPLVLGAVLAVRQSRKKV